ncbi:FliO/MopB family protein [Pedomonas mirosovicensis]|uniref:FliO/MopB family protein n=1 Tax=Pedomonas mirosovicensis TaxID=2908641 RepID=UPI00216956CB|nr:flagellar biosynthetic protein FliO [Pedomonas mirosovicensis]MCH8685113.1 flagellar biosynthetic protein FliO [Pedomonas mirosovicensis]
MDAIDYFRSLGALALVLAMLVGAAYALRRWGHRIPGVGIASPRGESRLAIVSTQMVDVRHKLVLVRRDDVEHLLLIGPQGTTLVESGIPSAPSSDKAQ